MVSARCALKGSAKDLCLARLQVAMAPEAVHQMESGANQDYFKGIYLQKKLTRCSDSCCPCVANGCNSQPQSQQLPASRIQLKLPRSDIAELITAKGLIVVDYIVEQLLGRRQGACRWPVSIQSAAGRDKSLSGF